MSDPKIDKVKGRVKEAVGALTGDQELKREGRIDQASADVKETANDLIDQAKDVVAGRRKDEPRQH